MLTAFVDESKENQYLFAVVIVHASEITERRKRLADLVLAKQRSVHFSKESSRRRRHIISVFLKLEMNVVVLKAKDSKGKYARTRLLNSLVNLAIEKRISQLILDLDETSLLLDKSVLTAEKVRLRSDIIWDFRNRSQEPLLWVADAVAWSLNRGGDWARMVRPMILETIEC